MYVASPLRRCNLRSCENFLDSVLPRSLFLSETLEKITFNPGLSGKLLLILENELETSPSSSSSSLSYTSDMEPDVDDEWRGEGEGGGGPVLLPCAFFQKLMGVGENGGLLENR